MGNMATLLVLKVAPTGQCIAAVRYYIGTMKGSL